MANWGGGFVVLQRGMALFVGGERCWQNCEPLHGGPDVPQEAELCHWPNISIAKSSTNARSTVVADPILKLCPAYSCCRRPHLARS